MTPAERLALKQIYREADRLSAAWAATAHLACPPGCGRCCETTDPACLPIEAEFLAEYLLRTEPRRAIEIIERVGDVETTPCIFLTTDSARCTVYSARPLVCRLFGFVGSSDSHGRPRFTLCREMPAPSNWNTARRWEQPFTPRTTPPLADAVARQLDAVRPDDDRRREPFSRQMAGALSRAALRMSLTARSAWRDDDPEPDPGRFPDRPAA